MQIWRIVSLLLLLLDTQKKKCTKKSKLFFFNDYVYYNIYVEYYYNIYFINLFTFLFNMCAETTQRSRNNRNTTIFAYVLLPTDVNSYAVELAMRTHGQQFQSDCLFIGHVLVYGSAACAWWNCELQRG